ncbi:MAG: hypothetical protein NTZ25_03885 [Candidatus Peregrinibacteria bacterium]|nr:hypothetical protein [Candidatus Peregrinibacteria bacterium]
MGFDKFGPEDRTVITMGNDKPKEVVKTEVADVDPQVSESSDKVVVAGRATTRARVNNYLDFGNRR